MNHVFVDGMSLIHLGVGIAMGLFRIPFVVTMAVAVVWEVAEHALKIQYPHMFMFPSQDTLANASFDVVCAAIGWLLAGRINRARVRQPRA